MNTELIEENGRLASVIEELRSNIETLAKEKEELYEKFEEQNQNVATAMKDLQNQILELTNRPCSCR